jgi:O-antigen ligase
MNRTEWGQLGSLHGAYIQILAQTGGAGVTAFVSMMGVIVLESIQTIRDAETNQAFAVVALCIITVQLIDWAFTFSAIHPMRWGVIGLMYGFISDHL